MCLSIINFFGEEERVSWGREALWEFFLGGIQLKHRGMGWVSIYVRQSQSIISINSGDLIGNSGLVPAACWVGKVRRLTSFSNFKLLQSKSVAQNKACLIQYYQKDKDGYKNNVIVKI